MPAAIGAAIARMLATMEPWVRSFMRGLAQGGAKNTRCRGTALVRAGAELLCSDGELTAPGQSQGTPSPPRPDGSRGGVVSRQRGIRRSAAVARLSGHRI